MKTLAAVLLVLGVTSCNREERAPAMQTTETHSPLELVREYVERDSRGERLRTAPWFLSVVAWQEDPAFDSYTVIVGLQVGQPTQTGDSATVPVTYQRLGWIQTTGRNTVRFVASDTVERYDFRLGVSAGRWLITEPRLEPHVLVDTVLAAAPLSAADRDTMRARRSKVRRP